MQCSVKTYIFCKKKWLGSVSSQECFPWDNSGRWTRKQRWSSHGVLAFLSLTLSQLQEDVMNSVCLRRELWAFRDKTKDTLHVWYLGYSRYVIVTLNTARRLELQKWNESHCVSWKSLFSKGKRGREQWRAQFCFVKNLFAKSCQNWELFGILMLFPYILVFPAFLERPCLF